MKTKYVLATAALAGLFAACSQEEIFDASAPKTDPLAGRPVVGEVELALDGANTRYNSEAATPETGDKVGLYLMDEFRGWNNNNAVGELENANETLFKYQSNWWQMYQMVDNIQTNYGYELEENGAWINRASQLVEGNYMVMFPQNEKATNRRDLWSEIKPVVDLKHHSTRTDKYYVNRENQFMLAYQQVYRDQKRDENGKLTLSIKLRPVLTYAKFIIQNNAANEFIAEKLVFKAPQGKALPTVAYVKPAGYGAPSWIAAELDKQTADKTIEQVKDECGKVLAYGLYDNAWFTQEVARGLVQYATTEDGHIPYGLTNEAPAYEYTFNFPDEEEGGVKLSANNSADSKERVLGVSIALPAFEGWRNMEVVVYGKMWDPSANDMKGAWRNGVLRKLGADNAEFTLDKLKLWESGQEIPTATLAFDDHYFYQENEIRVETTEDLLKLMDARLSSATTTENVSFEVYPYGKGLEITNEVVEMITNYEKKHGVKVSVAFKNLLTWNVTPIILKAENSINMFTYGGNNVVVEANQTSEEEVLNINELVNKANLTIKANLGANKIVNAEKVGVITVEDAVVVATQGIQNLNEVTLEKGTVFGTINNERNMVVNGEVTVSEILNNNECVDCGEGAATLTINKAGKLTVKTLTNKNGVVVNNGTLIVEVKEESNWLGTLANEGSIELNGDATIRGLKNNGTIKVAGETILKGTGNVNMSTISVAANAKLTVKDQAVLKNEGKIYVEGDLMENIKNSGYIYVIGNGHVGVDGSVEGKANGIIDVTEANNTAAARAAKDQETGKSGNYFRYTVQEIDGAKLDAKLGAIISNNNYGKNPIILEWNSKSPATFGGMNANYENLKVERVIIDRELTLNAGSSKNIRFNKLENRCNAVGYDEGTDKKAYDKAFQITKNGKVIVDNGTTLILNSENNEYAFVTAWIDGLLKVNNTGAVSSTTPGKVNVFGEGRCEFESKADSNKTWIKTDDYKGEWLVSK